MEIGKERFVETFRRVAPEGATLEARDDGFWEAGITVGGHALTQVASMDPGVRKTPEANAAGLAERLWDFVESHDAASRIAAMRARRIAEDLSMIDLWRKAHKYDFLAPRDAVQEVVNVLRTVDLTEKQAEEIFQVLQQRIRLR